MSDKRLVIVEWDDANCLGVWADGSQIVEPSKCRSIGWVHHETDAFIQLSATVAEDGQYNQSMTIPKGMVASIKDVG